MDFSNTCSAISGPNLEHIFFVVCGGLIMTTGVPCEYYRYIRTYYYALTFFKSFFFKKN